MSDLSPDRISTGSFGGRRGMTLIELLVVIVIIGILASIAIPKFSKSKERAVVATLRGDLRNIAVAQEAYYNTNATYYSGSVPVPGFLFTPSAGVSVTLSNVSSTGWGAASSSPATAFTCHMYHGDGGPLGGATEEGVIVCTE